MKRYALKTKTGEVIKQQTNNLYKNKRYVLVNFGIF